MRPVPETWEDFQVYWEHMCRNVLENNQAARDVLDLSELPKPPFASKLPDWMWALQRKYVVHPLFVWFTVGLYHPAVRELMGYTWSERDEKIHRLLGKVVGKVFTLVPARRPHASTGAQRLGSRHRTTSCRRSAGAHPGPQPAANRAPRQRDALRPKV